VSRGSPVQTTLRNCTLSSVPGPIAGSGPLTGALTRSHAGRGAQRITAAMGAGSIIGATLGGLAVTYAPVAFLKALLGGVLLAAAGKTAFATHNSN
jgi:uncharacterized membrane protein YfcA